MGHELQSFFSCIFKQRSVRFAQYASSSAHAAHRGFPHTARASCGSSLWFAAQYSAIIWETVRFSRSRRFRVFGVSSMANSVANGMRHQGNSIGEAGLAVPSRACKAWGARRGWCGYIPSKVVRLRPIEGGATASVRRTSCAVLANRCFLIDGLARAAIQSFGYTDNYEKMREHGTELDRHQGRSRA